MTTTKPDTVIGRFARSIESGWLGRIEAIEQFDDMTLCRMRGVNLLCWQIAGGAIEDHIDQDDTQWFAPADLRLVKLV